MTDAIYSKNDLPEGEPGTIELTVIRVEGPFAIASTDNPLVSCDDGYIALDAEGHPHAIPAGHVENPAEIPPEIGEPEPVEPPEQPQAVEDETPATPEDETEPSEGAEPVDPEPSGESGDDPVPAEDDVEQAQPAEGEPEGS